MRWPGSGSSDDSRRPVSKWNENLNAIDWQHYTEPRQVIPTLLLTATTLFFVRVYKSYLRRIPSVNHIKPAFFRERSLFGTVTRIHIRIAGIDAPEMAHFGRPAQPYSQEAYDWLKNYILNRRVRAYIYRRDQYDRVVASVFVRHGLFRRDVGLEMLKSGLATVYEAKTGSEFGDLEQKYRDAEAKAKEGGVGMWTQPSVLGRFFSKPKEKLESPREYKDRMKAEEAKQAQLKEAKGKRQGRK
ncbi:putative endonuclease lcl3 [Lasiodiplodia theobromae]|uniref:Probable endonuclease LCL3 n=1 Tax=Lasiodiplodia theobromae TaxID=45133 RepID=A0A5N5DIK2_9PEZI|nr:putative endonuclease lcl3 [Lasiodiplodia theobromae]